MYKNKHVTIFGLARSGLAAAKRLAALGARVLVSDRKNETEIEASTVKELQTLGVELELGGHTTKVIGRAELIVVSPGIPLDIPVLEQARAKGLPIISEIELAYQLLTKPIIAVTGTNGKTTTATLIGEMLKAGGKKVAVAGNIGNPLVAVNDADLEYIVAEISSYQLETTDQFRPWISVILNIQPDHFERHKTMREYIKQKARIFRNQTGDDYLVYNQDDPKIVVMVEPAKAKLIGFTKKHPEIITIKPGEIKIPGQHNLESALAAAQTAYLCGVGKTVVANVLRTFPGVAHRIELVAEINGVKFYNDSKATNPDATVVALETFAGRPVILILGGRDKGTDLKPMAEKIKNNVKHVILLGEAAPRLEQSLKSAGFTALYNVDSLAAAVKKSLTLAAKQDVVLLSPACASFDMFQNYEERGNVFKELVHAQA